MQSLKDMTTEEMLHAYGSYNATLRDFERDGQTFTKRYDDVYEKARLLLQEARRRDVLLAALDK